MVETWEQFNRTGIDNLFVYASQTSPAFAPAFLTAILLIFTLGGWFGSKRLTGQGDFFGSLVVGSLMAVSVSTIMRLTAGIVNSATQLIFIAVFIASILLFFFLRERG